ncbi:MAG TPA: ribosome silencing factor [Planctomycetes bacterium]|nr:ribosome silencing factor [Planctomycetota bacterium]
MSIGRPPARSDGVIPPKLANFARLVNNVEDKEILETAVRIAQDKKGEEIRILDVSQNLGITDFFLLVSADNRRQAQAICAEIDTTMKRSGVPKAKIEGYQEGWWILLDFDTVVIHIFQEEARRFYDLDNLWGDSVERTKDFLGSP